MRLAPVSLAPVGPFSPHLTPKQQDTPSGPYLPTVGSAPMVVCGARRLVAGWTGALFRLQRSSDSAQIDISAQPGFDVPDYNAIATWGGSSTLSVTKVYDQSGNGRDMTAAGITAVGFDLTHLENGIVPFEFVGNGYFTVTDAGASFSSQNVSYTEVSRPRSVATNAQDAMFHFMSGGSEVIGAYLSYAGTQFVYDSTTTANQFSGNLVPRCNLSAIGMTANASGQTLFCRETTGTTGATLAAGTGTTFEWGKAVEFGTKIAVKSQWGMALYPALGDPDMNTVLASHRTMFSVPTVFDSRIVVKSDSIMEGVQSTNNKELFRQISLNGTPEIFNVAISGSALSDDVSSYSFISALYTSAYGAGKCVLLINGGTNDIGGGASGATAYSRLTSLVSSAHGTGFKVVAATLLPRTDGAWTGAMETERGNYNSSMRGNAAGADQVVDLADTGTTMGALTAPNDSTLYAADHLHPTTLGYSYLAPEWAAKINLLI